MFGWFKKQSHTLSFEGGPTLTLEPGETVLNGALRHDVAFPFSCKVGGCGTCKCQLLSGQVKELTDKSYLLSKEEIQGHYILGCQSIPKTDIQIRLPVDPMTQQAVTGVITRQVELTHDIVEVFITLDEPLHYRAGQYAKLQAANLPWPARCYSYAHAAPQEGALHISFIVRRLPQGALSNWLTSPEALHQTVKLTGSLGQFYLRHNTRPMLCIAGGSGLAPLIALLEGALQTRARQREVRLLFGARTQRDLYYLDELTRIQSQWQAPFTVTPVLSDEASDSNWTGLRGLVTDHLDTNTTANAEAYLCGPPPMIDAAIARMTAQGIPPEHIHFDKFSDQSAT